MLETRKLMNPPPLAVESNVTLQDAACLMRDGVTGMLPVCEGNALIGVVTDRDITVRAIAEGKLPSTPVKEVMTGEMLCCYEEETIQDAGKRMLEHHVSRLPVLDHENRLSGVLALRDIISYLGGEELVKYGPMNDFA